MRPISQTFYINEPGGADSPQGVFVTRIDVYFKTINPAVGITLEIRETENGAPTNKVVPFGSCRLALNATPPRTDMLFAYNSTSKTVLTRSDYLSNSTGASIFPVTSTDASSPTAFEFETPVFLPSNKSYAFVLLPDGGAAGYEVWSADYTGGNLIKVGTDDNYVTDGGLDTLLKTPVVQNNDTGDLFLSSNDRTWLPVITEDLKFEIFIANFTSTTGTAYFNTLDEEYIKLTDEAGPGFEIREKVGFSNGYYNFAKLNVVSSSGVSVGHTITQGSVSGIVNSVSTGVVILSNTTGVFSTGSATNAIGPVTLTISSLSQVASVSQGSKTITVPDSSIFSTDQVFFFQTNNRSTTQVVKVQGKPSSATITVNSTMSFSDSNALYGRLIGDGSLSAGFSSKSDYKDLSYAILDTATSTSSLNLAGWSNNQIIGLSTGSSATVVKLEDLKYNTIHFKYNYQAAQNTDIQFTFAGAYDKKDLNYPQSEYFDINVNKVTDIRDGGRIALSRSNSLDLVDGVRPVVLKANMSTENSKISPVIDTMLSDVSLYENFITSTAQLDGTYLRIAENTGSITPGQYVVQTSYGQTNSTYGTIVQANTTFIRVNNVNGKFVSDQDFVTRINISDTSSVATGHVNVAEKYNESIDNGYYKASRYISKTVILAEKQDSESISIYLGAYRPANTDFSVYVKIQSGNDHENNSSKSWTKLSEQTNKSLQSSLINTDDLVELQYSFNQSKNVTTSGCVGNSTSNSVTVTTTADISNNSIVYFNMEPAKFMGSTVGTALTIDSFTGGTGYSGIIKIGQTLHGEGILDGTVITAGSGSSWTINQAGANSTGGSTLSSTSMTSGESAFNVREVVYVIDNQTLVLDRPLSTTTGNAAFGYIPGADSTTGAFAYDQNYNIVRYSTQSDAVYDNFIQFAIKIVPTADDPSIVPYVSDMRALALQV